MARSGSRARRPFRKAGILTRPAIGCAQSIMDGISTTRRPGARSFIITGAGRIDSGTGWFWVPGAEFSPGWVLWRTSPAYIGWAPMPPDQDLQNANGTALESADCWLFMDVPKFGTTCEAALPVAGYPTLLTETKFVRRVEFVDGIAVFVLPGYIVAPYVDVQLVFEPWPIWFFTQIIIYWNWIWTYVLLVNVTVKCIR